MQLRDIALKNLWRRKFKALYMIYGMVFGIATIVALFTITTAMEHSIDRKIQDAGLKLAIVPRTDTVSFAVGGIPVVSGVSYEAKQLPDNILQVVRSVPAAGKIRTVAPKLMGTAVIDGRKVLLVGVDFAAELKIKSWWEINGRVPGGNNQALVGAKAAEKLNLAVGDTIVAGRRPLTVTGVLQETGEDEDGIVFVNLPTARGVLGKPGHYSFVEIKIPKDEVLASTLAGNITAKVPDVRVRTVREAAEARQELVDRFGTFSLVVSFVMIIIASLIITTSMMASVKERTREIGILRAIGFRKAHITKIILTEAGLLSAVSGISGYIGGTAAAYLIAPFLASFQVTVSWDPLLGVAVSAGAVLLGLVSGAYPAVRAAGLDPAEALRFI